MLIILKRIDLWNTDKYIYSFQKLDFAEGINLFFLSSFKILINFCFIITSFTNKTSLRIDANYTRQYWWKVYLNERFRVSCEILKCRIYLSFSMNLQQKKNTCIIPPTLWLKKMLFAKFRTRYFKKLREGFKLKPSFLILFFFFFSISLFVNTKIAAAERGKYWKIGSSYMLKNLQLKTVRQKNLIGATGEGKGWNAFPSFVESEN